MRRKARAAAGGRLALAVGGGFLLLLGLAAALGRVAPGLPALYLLASLATYAAYAVDKAAARRGRWRTPERTLHLLALIGGWPGALVAQQRLRHKSAKPTFRIAFATCVIVNCTALACFLSPAGSQVWQKIAGSL